MDHKTSKKLKIGLLLDSMIQPLWVVHIIEEIISSNFAEISLVISNQAPHKSTTSFFKKFRNARCVFLWNIYCMMDSWKQRKLFDPFKSSDITALMASIPQISVNPIQKGFVDYFTDDAVSSIQDHQLDVALRFGFRIMRGRALNLAKYGVWSYHHDDNQRYRGSPPGFWEMRKDDPTTGSTLQVLSDELDGGKVLCRSWFKTDRTSLKRNMNNYYWQSSKFVIRELKNLFQNVGHEFNKGLTESLYSPYSPYCGPLYKTPTNIQMMIFFCVIFWRSLRQRFQNKFFREQWQLAYKLGRSEDLPNSFFNFRRLKPPRDRFWADPFPVEHQGKYYIFVEEFIYKRGKGHISVIELDHNHNNSHTHSAVEPHKVLETNYHLSYPFIFRWQDDYFMVPETHENKTIELYRATKFPFEWAFEKVLIHDIAAVDATLFMHQNTWWMFANILDSPESACQELHLFHAPSPHGPWTAHKQNPIISDIRRARPAGQVFNWQGSLYRPSQDCSVRYGHSVVLNKIISLSKDLYQEETISRITPTWDPRIQGVHTFNHTGRLSIVDFVVYRPGIT